MKDKIIKLADKSACTGCGACADACSKSCITMVRKGLHIYPQIDAEFCIGEDLPKYQPTQFGRSQHPKVLCMLA